MTVINAESFGFAHGAPAEAELVLDARRYLRDPARVRNAGLLNATGFDAAVRELVLATPGSAAAVATLVLFGLTFPGDRGPCTIAVGCVGGRHRSVALLEEAAAVLRRAGHSVNVTHRDVHRPRILTAARVQA